jgi:penicillin-binding protein 1C
MRIFRYIALLFVLASAVWLGLEILIQCQPIVTGLSGPGPPSSLTFLDRTGRPLRRILENERAYVSRCQLKEVSTNVVAATLSAEDKRFYSHDGIDWIALSRSLAQTICGRRTPSGASTITQQLVKLASGPAERSWLVKLREVWAAACLERHWSKNRILEEYLNRLDYGSLQIGIAAASQEYFDKPPCDLSPAEAAFLAGLPQAPSRLNPRVHFAVAKARQEWILGRMYANGYLDYPTFQRALIEPLDLRPAQEVFAAPHFVDLLLERKQPVAGGPVATTLDLALNEWIERVARQQLATLKGKHVTSAAVVVINNPTAEVRALVGTDDTFLPGTEQINVAWSPRSSGSAIKPFTYVHALELGGFPGTIVPDVPTDFVTDTGLYRPNNYNHRFYGPVTYRFALANSLNVAAVQVTARNGGPAALYASLQAAGITTLVHPANYYGLGLTIGNGEVRLLELTNAFAAFARLGVYRPYRLLPNDSNSSASGKRVFDERASYLVTDILSDNQARAATFGLNSYLRFDFPVASKTGTSSNYRDNWTVGYTPEWTVGVWVGNPDNSPMINITGVTGAAPIFHEVMIHLHDVSDSTWYRAPSGINSCWIDPLTGHQVMPDAPRATREICAFAPESARPDDYDSAQHVRLSHEYDAWLHSDQNTLGDLLAGAPRVEHLRVLQPVPGSFYFFDSDLPASAQRLRLRAEGSGNIEWRCPTLQCLVDGQGSAILLQTGQHEIVAHDRLTGEEAKTWIQVEAW